MGTIEDVDKTLYQPLRFTYGLVPIVAGLDKFTNLLTDWTSYLHPGLAALLPVDAAVFMRAIGIVEILVGVLVLTRFTRIGAYLAMAWLALIAVQLAVLGRFDIAVRDLVMAVGAWSLAQVAAIHERLAHGGEATLRSSPLEHAEAR
jgi:hypothetical protein